MQDLGGLVSGREGSKVTNGLRGGGLAYFLAVWAPGKKEGRKESMQDLDVMVFGMGGNTVENGLRREGHAAFGRSGLRETR